MIYIIFIYFKIIYFQVIKTSATTSKRLEKIKKYHSSILDKQSSCHHMLNHIIIDK